MENLFLLFTLTDTAGNLTPLSLSSLILAILYGDTHTRTHTHGHTHTHETIAGAHRPDSAPRRPRFCARATARACGRCPDALEIRVGEEAEAGKAGALARARLAVDGEDDVVHAQLVRRVRQRPHLPARSESLDPSHLIRVT